MTIDVQLTWPGLAELLEHYECLEVRPITGADVERETMRVSQVGTFGTATHSDVGNCLPILTPRWRFPSDKLPGAVCITCCCKWIAHRDKPRFDGSHWVSDYMTDLDGLPDLVGFTLPTPSNHAKQDIWLNPDHPANKGE